MRRLRFGDRHGMKFLLAVVAILSLTGCFKKVSKQVPLEQIVKLPNGHYRLLVEGKPYIIKGICYAPIPIGKSHLYNFMSDPHRPWITDGKMMKAMGANTIRLYEPGDDPAKCKEMITELYEKYGIRTILGSSLGFWDYPPPNYADKEFCDEVTQNVMQMVKYFKDTPGLLMWNLGNENNYSFDGRLNPWTSPKIEALHTFAAKKEARARIYYTFVNNLAKKIKKIDPNHLVSLGNGETVGLKVAGECCPDIDVLGCIVYRGKVFGNFFKEVKRKFDRPVMLTEFGCDAFNAVTNKEDQNDQAAFLKSQWEDIERNTAGGSGVGNCIGGSVFEWSDEWWKTSDSDRDSWWVHNTEAAWGMGAYYFDAKAGKNMNEEWFGIVALSKQLENGLNKRIPRKAYYVLRRLWTKKMQPEKTKRLVGMKR